MKGALRRGTPCVFHGPPHPARCGRGRPVTSRSPASRRPVRRRAPPLGHRRQEPYDGDDDARPPRPIAPTGESRGSAHRRLVGGSSSRAVLSRHARQGRKYGRCAFPWIRRQTPQLTKSEYLAHAARPAASRTEDVGGKFASCGGVKPYPVTRDDGSSLAAVGRTVSVRSCMGSVFQDEERTI
jgi:hypothetical protein